MKEQPLRTTVIGSYPFPGWLEFACQNLEEFGDADRDEMIDDAVIAALHDQLTSGLDVVTDGEQTRLDFNLSFYGFLEGVELESAPTRRFGPPAHDQRGKHKISWPFEAPKGLGTVDDFKRLQRLISGGKGVVCLRVHKQTTQDLNHRHAMTASAFQDGHALSGRAFRVVDRTDDTRVFL